MTNTFNQEWALSNYKLTTDDTNDNMINTQSQFLYSLGSDIYKDVIPDFKESLIQPTRILLY